MLTYWLINKLDPKWRLWHKLWSIRIALFWAALSGLWVALPAFQSFLPPIYFALLCVFFSLVMCIARITNQPGLQ